MSTELIITIIGVFFTIILGSYSIRYALKFRNAIKLTFIKEECISLFKSIVKSVDEIDIYYQKKPITPSLVLLKGCFVNNGNVDIDSSIVHNPLSMKLPDPYKWLEVKIVSSSPNVNIDCKIIDQSILEFEWDLLKKDEFFRFDSLVQTSLDEDKVGKNEKEKDIDNLSDSITFSQRITNLDKISNEEISNIFKSKSKQKKLLYLLVLAFIFGLFYTSLPFISPSKREIHYLINDKSSNKVEVVLSANKDNMLEVKGVNNDFEDKVLPEKLFIKYKLAPIIIIKGIDFFGYFVIILGISISLISLIFFIYYFYILKRKKGIIALLDMN